MINSSILFLICSVILSSFSQILLKKSASREHSSFIREYLNPYVIFGYFLMFVSTVTTILAYRNLEFKNGPIIESLGYILVMFLSCWFFSEPITVNKALGNGLILIGIIVFYV